jgi:hypothetical protein
MQKKKKSLEINFSILAGKLITIVAKKFKNLVSIKNNITVKFPQEFLGPGEKLSGT